MPRLQENTKGHFTGHTWAKVRDHGYVDHEPAGWCYVRHGTCLSACKLNSSNHHVYDWRSCKRLRMACICHYCSHAWRSQEKAITPKWSWILLHVSVQVGMFGDTNGIGQNSWIYSSPPSYALKLDFGVWAWQMNSWRLDVQQFQCCGPLARFECFGEWICSLGSGLDILQSDLRIIKQFIQGGQV